MDINSIRALAQSDCPENNELAFIILSVYYRDPMKVFQKLIELNYQEARPKMRMYNGALIHDVFKTLLPISLHIGKRICIQYRVARLMNRVVIATPYLNSSSEYNFPERLVFQVSFAKTKEDQIKEAQKAMFDVYLNHYEHFIKALN